MKDGKNTINDTLHIEKNNAAANTEDNNDTILWQGKSTKIGSVMYALKASFKIFLFIELIAIIPSARISSINTPNNLNPYIILVSQIIILLISAAIFIACLIKQKRRIYYLTPKSIFSNNFNIDLPEITGVGVDYGFWERNKKHGTLIIHTNTPKHKTYKLPSIPDPENIFTLLRTLRKHRKKEMHREKISIYY